MEPNIEELTREYNHACAWEVRHAIDSVTIPWDFETKNYLREQGYEVCVELYDQNLCIYAYVGKDDYFGPIKYEDDSINQAIQEVFDNLGSKLFSTQCYGLEWKTLHRRFIGGLSK